MRREHSLESGLKYLIIGSVGSATLLYGLAFVYGATGSTDYAGIAAAARPGDDVLMLTGVALVVAGLAFKASVAPFHQWTPDVYEGAPTAGDRVHGGRDEGGRVRRAAAAVRRGADRRGDDVGPALATLATITIVVGNVGAIGQSSLKRMLAYSSVAQAGYMLAGVVVSTRLGVQATVFYLMVYALMNLAAFAVIVARERETGLGDDISSLYGLGRRAAAAGVADDDRDAGAGRACPATAGFFGKLYLIQAAVDNDYGWLGVVIVVGSAISLAYYLRVIAAVWMRSPSEARRSAAAGGGRAAGDRRRLGRGGRDRAGAARGAMPGRGRVRGRGLRDGHDRLRHLSRPAVRRRAAMPGAALRPWSSRRANFRRAAPCAARRARSSAASDHALRPRPSRRRVRRPCRAGSAEYVALLALRRRASLVGRGRRSALARWVRGRRPHRHLHRRRRRLPGVGRRGGGLEPCTVGERHAGGGTTVVGRSVRIGGGDELTVATRLGRLGAGHDGRAERRAGAGVGSGIEASPLGLEVGVEGRVDFAVDPRRGVGVPGRGARRARFLAGEDACRRRGGSARPARC